MIEEELYDKEFVEKWCHGFDQVRKRAREYTLEKVAAITQVPAEKIQQAARIYATNRPGTFIEGMGVEHQPNCTAILHARWVMAALVGNLSKLRAAGHGPSIYRAMLTGQPYPIRAAICQAANPMVTQANTKLVYKALKSLDLLVVMDHWLTPTAELADYMLPAACWLERPVVWDYAGYSDSLIAGEEAVPPILPGEYEHRVDYDLWRGLGLRLGQEEYWPWKNLEGWFDYMLEPHGYTLKDFVHQVRLEQIDVPEKKYEEVGFGTPSGKIELYSNIFEKLGYDPLPQHREPQETVVGNPELAQEYPLTLITGGRSRELFHSECRNVDSIRKLHPHPLLQIHPETAEKMGIAEGDWVWIEGVRGRVRQKATLFDGIAPSVVHAEHGWWYPELPGEEPWLHGVWESNINVLMNDEPEACDPYSGGWPLRTALCKVYKVKTY